MDGGWVDVVESPVEVVTKVGNHSLDGDETARGEVAFGSSLASFADGLVFRQEVGQRQHSSGA